MTDGDRRCGEEGMTTVQYVAATAFSLIVFVMMANFIVFLYARGVVRAAVDEGARAGGRFGATTGECESRARDVLDQSRGRRRHGCPSPRRSLRSPSALQRRSAPEAFLL